MDLKTMSKSEIAELQKMLISEIKCRENSDQMIICHSCHRSSDYHIRKYHHWMKKVTNIDIQHSNGYAFEGVFLDVDKENVVNTNDWILE